MSDPPSRLRRVMCQLGAWHLWRTQHNEFGERWQVCTACKKERDLPGTTSF